MPPVLVTVATHDKDAGGAGAVFFVKAGGNHNFKSLVDAMVKLLDLPSSAHIVLHSGGVPLDLASSPNAVRATSLSTEVKASACALFDMRSRVHLLVIRALLYPQAGVKTGSVIDALLDPISYAACQGSRFAGTLLDVEDVTLSSMLDGL